MTDFLVILIIVAILSIAITYIVIQKKAGAKCIGCSMSKSCSCTCDRSLVTKYKEEERQLLNR